MASCYDIGRVDRLCLPHWCLCLDQARCRASPAYSHATRPPLIVTAPLSPSCVGPRRCQRVFLDGSRHSSRIAIRRTWRLGAGRAAVATCGCCGLSCCHTSLNFGPRTRNRPPPGRASSVAADGKGASPALSCIGTRRGRGGGQQSSCQCPGQVTKPGEVARIGRSAGGCWPPAGRRRPLCPSPAWWRQPARRS